jgi:DNA-binding transcriptional MerR regulator
MASLGLTVAAVARQLGVAPATLRTRDRRYGLGPSERSSGSHRRYTDADLARLQHMRRLVLQGIPPADAARQALAVGPDQEPELPRVSVLRPALRLADNDSADARHGGGRVIALPGATPAVRGLARAALALDAHACSAIIDDSIDRHGVVWAWEQLIVPVLTGVGERWETSGSGVEVEHLLSAAVAASLNSATRGLQAPLSSRAVLLACSDDELHVLPLLATAAALAEEGIPSRLLGERLPLPALEEAVRRTGPAAVLVWAQVPRSADVSRLAGLRNYRPAPAILIGGPGWYGDLPHGIDRVDSLDSAVGRIQHALGA